MKLRNRLSCMGRNEDLFNGLMQDDQIADLAKAMQSVSQGAGERMRIRLIIKSGNHPIEIAI